MRMEQDHNQKKKGVVESDSIRSISVVDQKKISKSSPFGNSITAKNCIQTILDDYEDTLRDSTNYHLGYPVNLSTADDYAQLAPLMRFHINNCGDPFIDPRWGFNSRQFELGVLDWFSEVWEINNGDYWGYITNGGTEGNQHGLWIARELHGDGILYATQDTHYSIFKTAKLYRMECVVVDSLMNGEMNYEDFRRKLLLNKDKPAIIVVNIGTTFKGAIDNLDVVIEILHESGLSDSRFYIHCDAALGLMFPFIEHAPKISFKKPIGSTSVSGHKFLGCPMPCGIQMTRKKYIDLISKDVECIYSRDATISGSRNGHAALYLWYCLSIKGKLELGKNAENCLDNARYFEDLLKREGIIKCLRNNWSLVVVFEKPQDDEIVCRWQLSCEGDSAHIVVLPNVTRQKLNDFFHQLVFERRGRTNHGGMLQSS